MTQKEKAKHYDEALERAKLSRLQLLNIGEDATEIEYIFPELKESEDDRIKGAIIHFISHTPTVPKGIINKEEMLAWLEKQGKQKPADNTGTKFKIGDFIKHNKANIICKVISVNSGSYYVENIETGGTIELFNAEQNFHLWTIDDVKDGDVLICEDGYPFIYAGHHIYTKYLTAYCGITDGEFKISDKTELWCNDNVEPATKKECELLYTKMKEAGYTFDFDKKELKRIEDEEYNGEDYGIDSLWHAQRILEKTLGKVDGYQTDDGILSHKCAISAVKKLYKKKPVEWHREDEQNLNATLSYIDDEYLRRWLKDAIYNKYEKPTEWSEEDEHRVEDTIYFLDTAKNHYASTVELDACIDWLKSLKERKEDKA